MISDAEKDEKCDNVSQPEAAETAPGATEEASAAEAAASAETAAPAPEPTPEEKLAEMQDKYLRTLAEYDNYRKRMARELQSTREYAKRSTLADVVGAYDLLQMAVESSAAATDMKALQDGIKMTFGEFQRTLKQLGVEAIDARGKKFDPAIHEAIQTMPSDTVPEGVVIQQWKTGFTLDGKLLRAAVVLVSSGPSKPAEEAKAAAPEGEASSAAEQGGEAETAPQEG